MSGPVSVPEPLLKVDAVAEILGVRERWIYEHIDELPHVRVGRYLRFEPSAVRSFIEERRQGPEANGAPR